MAFASQETLAAEAADASSGTTKETVTFAFKGESGDQTHVRYNLKMSAEEGLCMKGKFVFPENFGLQLEANNPADNPPEDWSIKLDTGADGKSVFNLGSHHEVLPKRVLESLVCLPRDDMHDTSEFGRAHGNDGDNSTLVLPVFFEDVLVEIDFDASKGTSAVLMGMDLLRSAKLVVNNKESTDASEPENYVIFSQTELEKRKAADGTLDNLDKTLKDWISLKEKYEAQVERRNQMVSKSKSKGKSITDFFAMMDSQKNLNEKAKEIDPMRDPKAKLKDPYGNFYRGQHQIGLSYLEEMNAMLHLNIPDNNSYIKYQEVDKS